ncbi:helix-turn-helix domain-containing protein [Spongiimicrobium sp. 2-473A-2-J]|uniref:helix-turn-helix domain-containing protein n=1 Tax=Eudoraea algarum TaxID=3417568 RepID=UPI003D359EB0
MHITPKHLNRITKATLNKKTIELITERVILEAKRLIVHSTSSLTEVARILGYEDYTYFSRVFKLKTNSSPQKFKKRYQ